MTNKIVRVFLAVYCAERDAIVKFERCHRCMFKDYEALQEHAVSCSFGVCDKGDKINV